MTALEIAGALIVLVGRAVVKSALTILPGLFFYHLWQTWRASNERR